MMKLFMFFTGLLGTTSTLTVAHAAAPEPQTPPILHLAQASMSMPEAAPDGASVHQGDIEVTPGFIRATMPGQPVAGGFFTMTNHGAVDDRLVEVKGVADVSRVELHVMSMDGDIMRMRKLADGIDLPAGKTVALTPAGLHMMLMGVSRPFMPGEKVTMTLVFAKAGAVAITLPVADMKGMAGGHKHN